MWTAEDRAWALALATVEAEACPDCGQPWAETSDLANEFVYVATPHLCHACLTGAKAVAKHQETGGTTGGLHVLITKRG